MHYLTYTLIILILATGCSRRPEPSVNTNTYKQNKKSSVKKAVHPQTSSPQERSTVLAKLYKQYNGWKGTPYKYGGLSKNGVDCSGFVHQTYRSLFNITLPRSTNDQVTQGRRVYINELSAGDLVFFKTGWNVRHVGIYLEKGKFAHASSSKGVMISSMYSGYWKENYWQARRLI